MDVEQLIIVVNVQKYDWSNKSDTRHKMRNSGGSQLGLQTNFD